MKGNCSAAVERVIAAFAPRGILQRTLSSLKSLRQSAVLRSTYQTMEADKSSPARRGASMHCGMSKLELPRRVILTGEILGIVKPH